MMDFMSELDVGTFLRYEKTRFCGIRPLVLAKSGANTKDIARNHVIEEQASGLLSLMGGKWTIYRKMG
jgi:glycerol-3-phosphate dehydrogenase